MNTLLFYSPNITERLIFTSKLIFEDLLGLKLNFTHHQEAFDNYNAPKIAYLPIESKGFLTHKYQILFENNISSQNELIKDIELELLEIKYNPSNDYLSFIFYLVSRYEEYLIKDKDIHHRFESKNSVLNKNNAFLMPWVNIWTRYISEELALLYPQIKFNLPKFQSISTIDVDSTFKYIEKGFWRTLGGFANDCKTLDFKQFIIRLNTILRLKQDEWQLFDELETFHQKNKTEVIYFWLLGNFGPYDKNIDFRNKNQKNIINKLSETNEIGIHPSYASNSNFELLEVEFERFKSILGYYPNKSRQHFLKHEFPQTYQNLIKLGIKTDYTLGYTNEFGFRAGIASPFYFFDLSNNKATELLLIPFCSMDITGMHYKGLNIDQTISTNDMIKSIIMDYNGIMCTLWHNESLSGTGRWQEGWEKVYFDFYRLK